MKYSTIPYGRAPKVVTPCLELTPTEMMFYLYLPIRFPFEDDSWESEYNYRFWVPKNLQFAWPFIEMVWADTGIKTFDTHFVYLTAKTMYVEPGAPGNRPGWHADGYGSNGDLNYIWYDSNPTEFAEMPFENIPDDDMASMEAMAIQIAQESCRLVARPLPIKTYPCKSVLRLDESVVHRVSPFVTPGVRTFLKASVSRHRYNLKGNSHNHLVHYDWEMHDRLAIRNTDSKDFVR